MRIEGEFTFDGPREEVWELLHDPDVLARALPGTETLERVGENVYAGEMRVGVGPFTAGSYDVEVRLEEQVPPERYTMIVDGRGSLGFARGKAEVELEEEGSNRTRMRYASDLQVGGKVAGVGQRLLDSVGRGMTKQGLEALNEELRARLEGGPGSGEG
ncbi:MAG: carbon monoxide dehydrogenase subunit G [Gemmatimonadota bacterium]|nr:carbon monoxide dehydrogenase subunit G [Gemmatimonadota bacterium]